MIGSGTFGSVPFASIPPLTGSAAAAPLILRIGADDTISKYLTIFGYRNRKQLNGRDVFDFTLKLKDAYRPRLGEEVVLTRAGVRLFAGTIDRLRQRFLAESESAWVLITLTCTDWHQILDRRSAVRAYENTLAGDIVKDLTTSYLADEGITAGTIHDGFVESRANWNHEPIASVLDDLCKNCGFYAFVDYEKRLHFLPREAATAPFGISEVPGAGVTAAIRGFERDESRADYRNTQIIKGWKEITNPQTARLKGDGTTRTWTVEFDLYKEPTARKSDGSLQDFGISGVEEGKQLYWSKGTRQISQDQDEPVLLEGEYVDLTYIGTFPGITYQQDPAEVAARRAIEGGTGVYEVVEVDASLEGSEAVIARGQALLTRHKLEAQATFELMQDGLDIGQLLPVHFPTLGLTHAEMLIQSVEFNEFAPDRRTYRITCTTGEAKNAYKEFWMKFVQTGQKVGVREGEIVQFPVPLADEVTLADVLSATSSAAHAWEIGVDLIGFAEVG